MVGGSMEGAASSAFEQLKESLSKFREREPRAKALDTASKGEFLSLLTSALGEPNADVLDVLAEGVVLPAPVVAEAIGAAWPRLAPASRDIAMRWLSTVSSDKRLSLAPRLAFMLLAGHEPDPGGAHQMLLLVPDSKEGVARVASEFFGADATGLDRLRLSEASSGGSEVGLRLLKAACAPKAQEYRRLKALQLVLAWAIGHSKSPALDFPDIVQQARHARQHLTGMTADPLRQWMEREPSVRQLLEEESPVVSPSDANPSGPQPRAWTGEAPATGASVHDAEEPTAELSPKAPDEEPARVPGTEAPPPVPHASGPLGDEQALARTVETLRAEADSLEKFLAQVRSDKARLEKQEDELCQARAAKQRAEQEAETLAAKLRASEADLQQATATRDAIKRQLDNEQQRTADLESDLGAMKTELDRTTAEVATLRTQVEALQIRVTANAEARLQELRSRISTGALKARRQVPDKLSTPSVDEGTIVLSRFYELLSALEQNGIKVEP